jgi:PleD family two-component response regulator
MDIRFYEIGLRQVASGLAKLAKPTPDSITQLVQQLENTASIAADAGHGAIATAAQKAYETVQSLGQGEADARATCVDVVGQLGRQLLADLCARILSPESAANVVQQQRCRVLVVDDSRVASTALVDAFRARDYSVRSAATLDEAFVELVLFAPSILVSDVVMPEVEVELLAQVFRGLNRGKPSLLALVSGTTGDVLNARLKHITYDVFVSKMEGAAKVVEKVVSTWGDDGERTSHPVTAVASAE